MKVIFLDFDGVLNNSSRLAEFQKANPGSGVWGNACPNPSSVKLIDELVEATNANIIISSAWRTGHTVSELQAILRDEFGLQNWNKVVAKTRNTDMGDVRGNQIDDWVVGNPNITHFVIIDDSTDMLDHHENNFVNTSMDFGFTRKDYNKALSILGK